MPAWSRSDAVNAPLDLVVGFSPGSASDIVAQALAPALAQARGAPVRIDRRMGADGTRAAGEVARAAPDGATLFVATLGTHALAPLSRETGYDPLADFVPVCLLAQAPLVLARAPGDGEATVAALIAEAAAAPGRLAYGSSATGGAPHLAAALFADMAGIDLMHRQYEHTEALYRDLEAGRVDLTFNNAMSMVPRIRAGTVRALAVTGTVRSAVLPDLPTVAESGLEGYAVTNWIGLVAPRGTPGTHAGALAAQVAAAVEQAGLAARFAAVGVHLSASTPAAMAAHLAAERARWRPVIERVLGAVGGAGE